MRRTSAYGYITPDTLKAMTPDYEPAVFARHVIHAGAKTVVVNGQEQFRINPHGYRGKDFSTRKPEGVIRIMFYGGSSVFDAESPHDDDWPHRVERLLHAKGFPNVEVINAGIPGLHLPKPWGHFSPRDTCFRLTTCSCTTNGTISSS